MDQFNAHIPAQMAISDQVIVSWEGTPLDNVVWPMTINVKDVTGSPYCRQRILDFDLQFHLAGAAEERLCTLQHARGFLRGATQGVFQQLNLATAALHEIRAETRRVLPQQGVVVGARPTEQPHRRQRRGAPAQPAETRPYPTTVPPSYCAEAMVPVARVAAPPTYYPVVPQTHVLETPQRDELAGQELETFGVRRMERPRDEVVAPRPPAHRPMPAAAASMPMPADPMLIAMLNQPPMAAMAPTPAGLTATSAAPPAPLQPSQRYNVPSSAPPTPPTRDRATRDGVSALLNLGTESSPRR